MNELSLATDETQMKHGLLVTDFWFGNLCLIRVQSVAKNSVE